MKRTGLSIGLTYVDPDAEDYNGWNGYCPGCDKDSNYFAGLMQDNNLDEVVHLQNNQATIKNVLSSVQVLTKGMRPDDLFCFYISGHGGQIVDLSGDEEDGMDETLCLWDGQLSDDILCELWNKLPPGVRVFFVTDTCNSGSNHRAMRKIKNSISDKYRGALIHYGGCDDGKESYGGTKGGEFTLALKESYSKTHTYASWFIFTRMEMLGKRQFIQYSEYGDVTKEFRGKCVFK